jgi:hypothetical protein
MTFTGNARCLKNSFTVVFQMLPCGECYENVQRVERWIACTPLSVKFFVTVATQLHLEYHGKDLFETPCISTDGTRVYSVGRATRLPFGRPMDRVSIPGRYNKQNFSSP